MAIRWSSQKARLGTLILFLGLLSACFLDVKNVAHGFVTRVLVISGFVLVVVGDVKTERMSGFLKTLFSSVPLNAGIAWFLFFLFYFVGVETSIPYSALSAACCTGIVVGAFFCVLEKELE